MAFFAGPNPAGTTQEDGGIDMVRTIKTNWSQEEEARLKGMVQSGASIARISAALNRPMAGIRVKARELGITLPTMRQVKAKLREIGVNG